MAKSRRRHTKHLTPAPVLSLETISRRVLLDESPSAESVPNQDHYDKAFILLNELIAPTADDRVDPVSYEAAILYLDKRQKVTGVEVDRAGFPSKAAYVGQLVTDQLASQPEDPQLLERIKVGIELAKISLYNTYEVPQP